MSGTRRDSKQVETGPLAEAKALSMDGVNAKRRTYLGSPHHPPIISGGLQTT